MASNSRELKTRMKAVRNIQRITKTMQMIATARFQAMQRRATEAKAYSAGIESMVGRLAASVAGSGEITDPLLSEPAVSPRRELLLIVTSNRGLCGGYNGNVLRAAHQYLRAATCPVDVELIGRKGQVYCKFNHIEVGAFHSEIGDTPEYAAVEALADDYMERYASGAYDRVSVVSMAFEKMSRQYPEVAQLLPIKQVSGEDEGASGEGSGVVYEYSPEPEALLAELLPVTVRTSLFQRLNEAVVSEQIARMIAMKSATDSAGKMGKSLKRLYNRARQTQITTELNEIISGAAALN
ncbi:ATP synthase F1 subunit gamma [Mucisphaera calidilacus]|uniref:ATP synthase gamma chain n=1 Tax=Mucisphaera calidilacus TaxID=2527982 RepID=A0A518BZ47_9BACT|nr:ATP synthase F1 subunit gamma [Mucisphaera calidilacus]QDU72252.1 ATP synthase gamma chain [Mucisphaera calidilacus]